jgi:DNA uptake protein ComE-like DNA-binding protein
VALNTASYDELREIIPVGEVRAEKVVEGSP